jgi:acetyl esterase/lipase
MDAVRLALAAERRLPGLARYLAGRPTSGATGRRHELGAVWSGGSRSARPLIVLFTEQPEFSAWFASRLAARLGAVVMVPDSPATPYRTLVRAYFDARELQADGARIVAIGEGAGAGAALLGAADARDERRPTVAGLALLHPLELPSLQITNLPPTLALGYADDVAPALWQNLRTAGVPAELASYPNLPPSWLRHPGLVPEADLVLAEVADFAARSFGLESTFGVRRPAPTTDIR